MGLFDNIIGTSTEEVEPLGIDMITDDSPTSTDGKSSGSGSGSGSGSDQNGVTVENNTPSDLVAGNEIPDIDIGGNMGLFLTPESTEIPLPIDITTTTSTTPTETASNNTPEEIPSITPTSDTESITLLDATIPETSLTPTDITPESETPPIEIKKEEATDISPIEALDLNRSIPTTTDEISKNHEPLAARISAFLKELQDLKKSDEETKIKLAEELKQIEADEKKINDTITLLNNIKNV